MSTALGPPLFGRKRVIGPGDCVIVYGSRTQTDVIWVTPGKDKVLSELGHYPHNNIVGIEYGSKMYSKGGQNSFVYLLRPTTELWTLALSHRTEILYTADISMILLSLEITPGTTVVETGTGSGSLSVAFARAVAPTGHLFTFEFHEGRVEHAREDFKKLGLESLITVTHRDTCADGFTIDPCSADAVFLDLPSPWLAVSHAYRVLKPNKSICSFSPCIEQVQRTCLALAEQGFVEIKTIEVLKRNFDVEVPRGRDKAKNAKKRTHNEAMKTEKEAIEDEEVKDAMEIDCEPAVQKAGISEMLLTRPNGTMRGHTGYLTFARSPLPSTQ